MDFVHYFFEHNHYLNIVGIILILFLAWLMSRKRSAIDYKMVFIALTLQIGIALVVLKTSIGQRILESVAHGVNSIYQFADAGSSFMFGNLIDATGSWGFIFAFKVLPIIIFFSALTSILFYLGIIQLIVGGVNMILQPLLGTSGAETLVAIANSFLGPTEAPLLVKNYLKEMTKSEMLTVMVSGMATISASVLVVYSAMGIPAQHLLAASVMAIPGSLLISKMLYPETEQPATKGAVKSSFHSDAKNFFDAIALGTCDGLMLALNIGAMLITFLALIALLNALLIGSSHGINGILSVLKISWNMPEISLSMLFGYIFSPIAYLLGITGDEALAAGQLLGTKLSINELVAYGQVEAFGLSERTVAILTYALCGMANFSVIGIMIGGIGAMAPEKRSLIAQFGLMALLGGTLCNLLSALIAALII